MKHGMLRHKAYLSLLVSSAHGANDVELRQPRWGARTANVREKWRENVACGRMTAILCVRSISRKVFH
jgi:hypothetical protein